MCHYVLKQVFYMLPTQCLNLRGKVVKEDFLFLVLLDPEDKTKHFSTSATIQPKAPCHILHDSTNGMVPHEANSQPMPVPHPRKLFNQWHSSTSQIIIQPMAQCHTPNNYSTNGTAQCNIPNFYFLEQHRKSHNGSTRPRLQGGTSHTQEARMLANQ
jgi:hypothetical protein